MIATTSDDARPSTTASRMASKSSGTGWRTTGSPPHWRIRAARIRELNSGMSPGLRGAPMGVNSSPVGIIVTRGRRRTGTAVRPAAAQAPRSAGVMRWFSGSTNSVATISSPSGRTCCQGATGSDTRTVPGSAGSRCTCSIITTASIPIGMGSPVSTQTAWLPTSSATGRVSVAPTVSDARTAMPSIAAAS